jgi:hypothetical protein
MEKIQLLDGDEYIFIPYNTPSSKNSKQWTGKFLIPSKTVKEYTKNTKNDWLNNKDLFLSLLEGKEKPYCVAFHFVRKSKHKFDFINACQIVQDLMVEYKWLDDDNMDEMIPAVLFMDNNAYTYDKTNPGVYIKVV